MPLYLSVGVTVLMVPDGGELSLTRGLLIRRTPLWTQNVLFSCLQAWATVTVARGAPDFTGVGDRYGRSRCLVNFTGMT